MHTLITQWAEQIHHTAEKRIPLILHGGKTKDFYGHITTGTPFDLNAYPGIIDYEPSELVITVRGGTRLAEIESVLAQQNQFLAFEPPYFGAGSTIAGSVAAGLSGPRRASAGAVRDFVLGVKLIDGRGKVLSFGGRVMKNVAGYDVSRLIAGSLGTLGVIAELSLKVLPIPTTEITLCFESDQREALKKFKQWGQLPFPISASTWVEERLFLRLSGAKTAVNSVQKKLGGELIEEETATSFWNHIRNQTHPFFNLSEAPLWRLSLPPTAPPLDLPGQQLIEWGGALRWLNTTGSDTAEAATMIRHRAMQLGGHATLFRSNNHQRINIFTPLPPALLSIHRRLKAAFDPQGIFNPGRLYPGL